MTDRVSKEKRSEIMRSVKREDTEPEMIVRKLVFSMGYRYRLHRKDLPGSPDLAFLAKRKVIFVHGCFWHGHRCRKGRSPKSNLAYWGPKLIANKARDKATRRALMRAGWRVKTVWQCQLGNQEKLKSLLAAFLDE